MTNEDYYLEYLESIDFEDKDYNYKIKTQTMKTLLEKIEDHTMDKNWSRKERLVFAYNVGSEYGYNPEECGESDDFLFLDMKWNRKEIETYQTGLGDGYQQYTKWCNEVSE